MEKGEGTEEGWGRADGTEESWGEVEGGKGRLQKEGAEGRREGGEGTAERGVGGKEGRGEAPAGGKEAEEGRSERGKSPEYDLVPLLMGLQPPEDDFPAHVYQPVIFMGVAPPPPVYPPVIGPPSKLCWLVFATEIGNALCNPN